MNRGKMKAHWSAFVCAFVIFTGLGMPTVQAQQDASQPSVLHIVQTKTTSTKRYVPTFLTTYHVLDGAKSPTNLLALKGTLSLKNDSANFSQVLWVMVYWQGECPKHDIGLKQIAGYLWIDITKNPSQSKNTFPVDLRFPNPIPATGCIGFYYGGGPVFAGKTTMSADLDLTYERAQSVNPNTVVSAGAGEYVFGQNWGGQNFTTEDEFGFAVPTPMNTSGHLLELYGNLSDSTFDGTNNFGPLPTGKKWGAINDWYLLRGGCGEFGENLNFQGFPNPLPLPLLYSWLPSDAQHLVSVSPEYKIPEGGTGEAALQRRVERIFSPPVQVNAGDCLVTIYGRRGNGATDDETQVNALMAP